jgi:hypothetical protein
MYAIKRDYVMMDGKDGRRREYEHGFLVYMTMRHAYYKKDNAVASFFQSSKYPSGSIIIYSITCMWRFLCNV